MTSVDNFFSLDSTGCALFKSFLKTSWPDFGVFIGLYS